MKFAQGRNMLLLWRHEKGAATIQWAATADTGSFSGLVYLTKSSCKLPTVELRWSPALPVCPLFTGCCFIRLLLCLRLTTLFLTRLAQSTFHRTQRTLSCIAIFANVWRWHLQRHFDCCNQWRSLSILQGLVRYCWTCHDISRLQIYHSCHRPPHEIREVVHTAQPFLEDTARLIESW